MFKYYNWYWKENEKGVLEDYRFKIPIVKRIIPKKGALTLLDYGCGIGTYVSQILKINPKINIIGMDISDRAIKIIKKKFPKGTFFVQTEEKKFPVRNNTVDFILAMDVIEHVFDAQTLFGQFHHALKPGGKIFISTPYHGFIKNLCIVLLGFDKAFDPTAAHIRFFSVNSLRSLLEKKGFKILKVGFFGRFFPVSRGMYMLAEKA